MLASRVVWQRKETLRETPELPRPILNSALCTSEVMWSQNQSV